MRREEGSIWYLALLVPGLLPGCYSEVVIDSYTHNSTLTSGDSISFGKHLILVCRVVGLPYGTPLSYTWTCPNRPCEVEGYYGRKIYNEHILAVNTTSTSDGGTYTCWVTATGGQETSGNFTLRVTGGSVVHSYGRLIPHEFPITDLQQISGPDGIGRITCTVSSGKAKFIANSGQLEGGGVSQTRNGATATLVVNSSNADSFQNRGLYCTNYTDSYFYLFLSSTNPLSVPGLMVDRVTNSAVEYQVRRNDGTTDAVIIGYEVIRFGVPMIGEYVNEGNAIIWKPATIRPAVPGAQYRITLWALGDGRRSAISTETVNTVEAIPTAPRSVTTTRMLRDGVELNWLPPTEPNGEVRYVIYYTPEGGTEQSIDTGSDLTHYNLTGLERNKVYTNIAVQAINSAGSSERSNVIAPPVGTKVLPSPPATTVTDPTTSAGPPCSCPIPPATSSSSHVPTLSNNPLLLVVISLGAVVLLLITCVALLVLALAVTATKLKKLKAQKGHADLPHLHNKTAIGEGKIIERVYDDVGKGTGHIGGKGGQYQELNMKTLEKQQYQSLTKKTTAKA